MNEQGMFQAITHHVASCSYWQPRGGCFSYSCCSLKGCACLKHYLFKASNTTSWGVTTRGTEGDVSPHGHRRQGGVQCRLTASMGLRLNRRHTPCSCGYDVGCCRYKKQGVYVSYFFLTFFSHDIIEKDCEHSCRLGSLSWFSLASDAGKRWCMTSHKNLLTFSCYGNLVYA